MPDNWSANVSGIDMSSLEWRRAGGTSERGTQGVMEVAITARGGGGSWVLLRVAEDPGGLVLVYDQHEWECFLDGVRNGEFDLPG